MLTLILLQLSAAANTNEILPDDAPAPLAPITVEATKTSIFGADVVAPVTLAGRYFVDVVALKDAPCYCGTGRWNHRYGVSTWTSDRTWRPLPRREYTKRDDYNAINAGNRHTITPQGWTHEQDNTKVRRAGEQTVAVLVREFGYNDYQRIDGFDFSPGYDYWARTAPYWSRVRAAWSDRLADAHTLTLNTAVDGMVIIVGTFEQAARAATTDAMTQTKEINALLAKWTHVESVSAGASAAHTDEAP